MKMVSPFLGSPISYRLLYAVKPGMPRAPMNTLGSMLYGFLRTSSPFAWSLLSALYSSVLFIPTTTSPSLNLELSDFSTVETALLVMG